MRGLSLHTVCEEALCPNIGEWESRTATFMVLGNICTRRCAYCAVATGRPAEPDLEEPARVAQAAQAMGLRHAVITSVNRDDLADGGASIFAATIRKIREAVPGCSIEVLVPDFRGDWRALETLMRARPDILNHNIETVRRLFRRVRPRGSYERSLELLRRAQAMEPDIPTKSGLILGLGENWEEILQTMADLRAVGCDILTIGQYLRPTNSPRHIPIARYYTPEEFRQLKEEGQKMGFRWVESGPLVRSSYHARQQVEKARPRP